MYIDKKQNCTTKYEYGCDLRRLYPNEVDDPFWGAALASVRPNESTTAHSHDEKETFFFISGEGEMRIGDEVEHVVAGDVVYIPKDKEHQVTNTSSSNRLEFISVFWDSPESIEKMKSSLLGEADYV